MDIESVARFVTVLEKGSFAAAARSHDITAHALSTSIGKLEQTLGVTLFDRERGRVTQPTEFGLAFLTHARFIVAAEQKLLDDLHAQRDALSGWVKIGVGEGMARGPVARAVSQLRREAPAAHVAIVEGYTTDMVRRMDAGELDIVVGSCEEAMVQRPDIELVFLHASQDVMVARREHPLAPRSNVGLDDLRAFPWMVPHTRPDNLEVMCDIYARHGVPPPEEVLSSDSATVGLDLLADEDYVLFISRDVFWPRLGSPGARFVELDAPLPLIERRAFLVQPTSRAPSMMTERLRELLLAQVALFGRAEGRSSARPTTRRQRATIAG